MPSFSPATASGTSSSSSKIPSNRKSCGKRFLPWSPSWPETATATSTGSPCRLRATSLTPEDNPGFSLTVPSRQIVRACGYSIFLVHGHRHSVDVSLDVLVDATHAMDCDIAVFGHTHIPFAEEYTHILALNPGSPSRPRGRSEPGFAVIELDSNSTTPKYDFFIVSEGYRGNFRFDGSFLG